MGVGEGDLLYNLFITINPSGQWVRGQGHGEGRKELGWGGLACVWGRGGGRLLVLLVP